MHAVDPAKVREAPRLTTFQVVAELLALGMGAGDMLVLSGGNPALHHLDTLLDAMRTIRVHVETQGTVFRPWLNRCELVVCSPKPPSAWGQQPDAGARLVAADRGVKVARQFCARLTVPWVLKLVAFDGADLDWAVGARRRILACAPLGHYQGAYLSAGTDQDCVGEELAAAAVLRYRWLANQHVARPELGDFKIGLQAHVLAWPGEMGR